MVSLGAAAGWGLHCILAFQSLQDLADMPADLGKDAVRGSVMENCAIQLSESPPDPERLSALQQPLRARYAPAMPRTCRHSTFLAQAGAVPKPEAGNHRRSRRASPGGRHVVWRCPAGMALICEIIGLERLIRPELEPLNV